MSEQQGDQQAVVIKRYVGNAQQIQAAFQRDSAQAIASGYEIHDQTLVPGKRGGCLTAFMVICVIGIPFLFVRPPDTLIVTYRLRT